MGKGSSSAIMAQQYALAQQQAAMQQSTESYKEAATGDTVTPAIAKSIAQDTASAQSQQLADRQRMRGISSTYLRGASGTGGGKTKLGQ